MSSIHLLHGGVDAVVHGFYTMPVGSRIYTAEHNEDPAPAIYDPAGLKPGWCVFQRTVQHRLLLRVHRLVADDRGGAIADPENLTHRSNDLPADHR